MTGTTEEHHQSNRDLADLLAVWLPSQRWFAGKGGELGPVTIAARSTVADNHDGARIEHIILEVATSTGIQHYQLFLGWRRSLTERLAHSIIGSMNGETAYDALHEAAVSSRLIAGIANNESWGELRLSPEPEADIDADAPGMVIGGEQSNTSIIFGDSAILKVYRRIEPGINPDVDIHRALKAAGSKHVAAPLGVIEADVSGENTTLGFMASFFANSADGWAMATASVRDLLAEGDLRADEVGGDFAAESHRLGEAVAEVHRDLAAAFGTEDVDADGWQITVNQMIAEAESVAAHVPSLAAQLDGIRATFEAARGAGGAAVRQRIHGDLHLGQTLRTLRGWVVIDFEESRPNRCGSGGKNRCWPRTSPACSDLWTMPRIT